MNMEIRSWPYFVIEILSVILLVCCFIPLMNPAGMAGGTVPTHFDVSGAPDGSGDTGDLVWLALMGLFIYIVMSLGERFPKLINVPVRLNDTGKEYLNENGWKLMRVTKLCCLFLMAYISWWTYWIAVGKAETMPMWGVWLPICLMLGALAVFLYKLYNWN